MNAPAPWTRVLLALWQQRRNQGSVWPLLMLAGALGAGAAFASSVEMQALALTLLSIPLISAWIWLWLNLLQQNHPTAARLVPGHVRTLRLVMLGAWFALTSFAALVGLAFGQALTAAAGTGASLLILAWMFRLPLLSVAVWILPAASSRWVHAPAVEAASRALAATWLRHADAIAAVFLLMLLAAALGSAFALLRAGDPRHTAAYRRRTRQLAAIRTGGGSPTSWQASGSVVGDWIAGGATGLYRRWLERVSTQRKGTVLSRALLGLGPVIHWTGQLGQVLTFGTIAALVLGVLWQSTGDAESIRVAAWGLSIGVLTFAVNVALQARAAIHGTRREQALMMLLPGMPRGRVLNAGLVRRLSVQFICSWLLGVLACAAILPLGTEQGAWFATYAAACLPIAALLWTDWSRVRAPTPMSAVAPVLVAMSLTLCAIAAQKMLRVPAWSCVLGFVVAAVVLVGWRVWQIRDRPSAFPAGRLSDRRSTAAAR